MSDDSSKNKKQKLIESLKPERVSWFWVVVLSLMFSAIFFITFYYIHKRKETPVKAQDKLCILDQNAGASFNWLNPQLQYIEKPIVNKTVYDIFVKKLTKTIEQLKAEGRVSDVAVFFRDLSNGPTFGINQDDKFVPASLLKLPLLFTYFRLAEKDPSILDQQLATEKFEINLDSEFPPAQTLKESQPYQVEDLLSRMIIYSDNRSWELLWDYLWKISPNKDLLLETYKELGIADAETEAMTEKTLSVKSYASLFRLLYNASYLSKEFSDKALDYLIKAEFKDGLRQGVPDTVPIAHKFGERFDNGIYELHDCGIIYYPSNPYLLCVMTEGKDMKTLPDTIGTISKAVYQEFNSRKLPD